MNPIFSEAMVLSPEPSARGVRVVLSSGQVPSLPVKVLHHGAADGVAVDLDPLPRQGTWGMCVFPYGDSRNGIWLGSLYLSGVDAVPTDTDANVKFNSHWSGAYELTDGEGRYTHYFPDGTYLTVSDSTASPSIYRHTVDENQERQLTLFPDADRVAASVSPRHVYLSHASGASAHIDPSGNVDLNMASGGFLNITVNGASAQYMLVRADLLVTAYNAHTHTAPDGATSTPNQQLTVSQIQSAVMKVSG